MIMQFSDIQIAMVRFWLDPMIRSYLRARYGDSWLWYWVNWEVNNELLW